MKKPTRKRAQPGRNPERSVLRPTRAVAMAAVALLALGLYVNSIGGRYVFDDTVLVQGNEAIRSLSFDHLQQILGQHYWRQVEGSGGLYRPVTMLSYTIEYAVAGEDPHVNHLTNVLLHALNGVLLFLLLEELFVRRDLALWTALFFVAHPIRTEGVASIVGRAECLSAFFMLGAWLLYIRHRKHERPVTLWGSSVLFVLAVLSKETAFAALALLPLSDYLLGAGTLADRCLSRSALRRYLPFAFALTAVLLLRYAVLGGLTPLYINPRSNPLAAAPPWQRFLTAATVFGRYVWLLVWPVRLSADYSFNQIPVVTSILGWLPLASLAVLGAVAALVILSMRRHPVLFFSGAVFFCSYLLISNWIRPIGTIMGERLMYFPAIGFNCAVAFLLCRGFSNRRWKAISGVAAAVLLVGYSIRCIDRNLDWHDHYALFGSAVRTCPDSALAHANFASVLLNERNDPTGAAQHAKRATEIYPQDPAAYFTLGLAYGRLGESAAAVSALEQVVELAPRTSGGTAALRSKARIEESAGNYAGSGADYARILQWWPDDADACAGLGRVCAHLGSDRCDREMLDRCGQVPPGTAGALREQPRMR
jgi:protein O-mannosyl-transferase